MLVSKHMLEAMHKGLTAITPDYCACHETLLRAKPLHYDSKIALSNASSVTEIS